MAAMSAFASPIQGCKSQCAPLVVASSNINLTSRHISNHNAALIAKRPRTIHHTRLNRIYAQQPSQNEREKKNTPSNNPFSSKDISGSRLGSSDDNEEELETAFRVFDWTKYGEGWDVPWGGKETLGGMAAWAGSFVGVGLAFLPIAAALAGPGGSFATLSQHDKAILALCNQIAVTGAGLGVLWLVTKKFEPLPDNVLKFSLKAPFRKPDGWLMWGLLGVLLAPLTVYFTGALVESIGADDVTARGTADAVSQILSLDGTTFGALFTTTAILAPLLEETVFRGFLLTSLTKFMPTPLAVGLSSVAFGLVHLSPRDFPQLTALGVLLGFVYIRSKNLLTPIMIHGAWNGTVLSVLYALKASGVDLQEVLHGKL